MTTTPTWVARRLGGPLGGHAYPRGIWYTMGPWAMVGLTLSWVVLMVRQLPCRAQVQPYSAMCYTDITALFGARGLGEGKVPYLDTAFEYPVLTGAFVELTRRLAGLLGAQMGPDLPSDVSAHAANVFFGTNAVLLFVLFIVVVWAHLRMSRPQDAIWIAISPAIWTAGLINWDALVVALTSLALLAWARRRPGLAGVLIGLGAAAKLYPAFLLLPVVMLCLRTGRWRRMAQTVGTAAATWVVVNVPVYVANPDNWGYFWQYNAGERDGDLGSLWYVLTLMDAGVPDASSLWLIPLVIGLVAICALLLLAPRRPRLAQGAFLVVAWFLIVNKVYSPQYVLWLLPLLVLARPRWRDWIAFSVAETFYFACVWLFLDGALTSGASDQAGIYWVAVALRIGVQLWLCGRVVRDILWPDGDIVRVGDPGGSVAQGVTNATGSAPRGPRRASEGSFVGLFDDPDGGLLDWRRDAPWLAAFRRKRAMR